MQDSLFDSYLRNLPQIHNPNVITDYKSRCARVEKGLAVDLDREFERDRLESVLLALRNPSSRLANTICGDVCRGLSSLRSSVNAYRNFKFSKIPSAEDFSTTSAPNFPEFSGPDDGQDELPEKFAPFSSATGGNGTNPAHGVTFGPNSLYAYLTQRGRVDEYGSTVRKRFRKILQKDISKLSQTELAWIRGVADTSVSIYKTKSFATEGRTAAVKEILDRPLHGFPNEAKGRVALKKKFEKYARQFGMTFEEFTAMFRTAGKLPEGLD